MSGLRLTNLEHLGAACRAGALGSRAKVFHRDGFGIFHLLLGTALHAITLNISHITHLLIRLPASLVYS